MHCHKIEHTVGMAGSVPCALPPCFPHSSSAFGGVCPSLVIARLQPGMHFGSRDQREHSLSPGVL